MSSGECLLLAPITNIDALKKCLNIGDVFMIAQNAKLLFYVNEGGEYKSQGNIKEG